MLDSRGQLQDIIAERAANDPRYRAALLASPKKLLQKHLEFQLPGWLSVQVVEESADTIFVVVPHVAGEELADEDLEVIAGGKDDTSINGNAGCQGNFGAFNSRIADSPEIR